MVYGGRGRRGRVRGAGRHPLRDGRSRRGCLRTSRWRSRARSGTRSARSCGWAIGLYGGRPYLERHGRWLHLTSEKLDRAERWFERWEDWAVFLGRLTPVVRSFVSIPAGVLRGAVRPLHAADARRLRDLVLRLRRRGLRGGRELGGLPPRVPLRRLRRRARRSWLSRPGSSSAACVAGGGSPRRRRALRNPRQAVRPTCRSYTRPRDPSTIPLVDVKAQYAPLIPELRGALRRRSRVRPLHLRAGGRGVRARGGGVPRRAARDRRRERHRRARPRARGARDRARATR